MDAEALSGSPPLIDVHAHYISPLIHHNYFFAEQEQNLITSERDGKQIDPLLRRWFMRTMAPYSHRDAGLECLLEDMSKSGVTQAVIAATSSAENRDVNRITKKYELLYGLLWLNQDQPRKTLELLIKTRSTNPRIVGLKSTMQYRKMAPNHPSLFPVYEYLNDHQLPVQFHAGVADEFSDFAGYADLARRFPAMRIMLLHAGGERWREVPDLCAAWDNVSIELEALQLDEVDSGCPVILEYLLEHCPPGRLLFGSDWIWSEAKYFKRVGIIGKLSPEQQAEIGWQNAVRILNLPIGKSELEA